MDLRRDHERGGILTLLVVGLVIVVAAGATLWWFFIRSDAAPPPKIKNTTIVAGGTLDGRWNVKPDDLLGSFVQYRVTEQFAAASIQSEATGKTSEVTGTMTIAGDTISDVTVSADLSTLTSDRAQRDRKIKTDGLQSDQFPESKFVLTEPIKLAEVPRKGQRITTDATGDFTLHGITKHVTIPLQGRWDGETVQVIGKLPITFADYGITPPNIGGFVSVSDQGRMELQLFFVKG